MLYALSLINRHIRSGCKSSIVNMIVFTCVFLALCIVVAVLGRPEDVESKHWAVIVAGSAGYDNYRHQVSNISSKRGHHCKHLTLL